MAIKFPRVKGEQSLKILTKGYLMPSVLRKQAGLSPDSHRPFTTRLLGKGAVIVRGDEGVDFFYDSDNIERDGAMPKFVQFPLFGNGAVHTLDGEDHRVRKNAMADMAYEDDRVAQFEPLVAEEVDRMYRQWASQHQPGDVHADMALAFGRAAFRWAGIRVSDKETDRVVRQLNRLLDTFGKVTSTPIAIFERFRTNKFYREYIEKARAGEVEVPQDSVVEHMANLRDKNGELVDAQIAGIELQNLTRPTIAVGRFAAFAAVALVEHPEWAERIRNGEGHEAVAFAQETRRAFPFVPMLPGFARKDAEVSGCPVHKGQRVILDIVGTLNSPKEWKTPGSFDPERFMDYPAQKDAESITSFIPQGGADVRSGHRCPGEKIAVAALSSAVEMLSRPDVQISTDREDTTFDWTKILTRPDTGVRVTVR